jgi:SPP1 gp7 family putative phage head morphogenesis protein
VYQLRHFVQQTHPRFNALRARRNRKLNAIKPSAANRIWYAQQLHHHILTRLRTAGIDVMEALRNHWPPPPTADRARDAEKTKKHVSKPAPVVDAVARARQSFPDVGGFAVNLSAKVVKRNLDTVDDRLSASIENSLGIDIRQNLVGSGPILTEMDDALSENVDLITSIPEQYFDDLEEAISNAWTEGKRWEELAPEIQEIGEVTERRAEFIARDQTAKLTSHFNRSRSLSLGIKKGIWHTAGDDDVRPTHAEMEGVEFSLEDPPLVGDEYLLPGEDYGCRCDWESVFDLDDDAPEDLEPDEEEIDEDEAVEDEEG